MTRCASPWSGVDALSTDDGLTVLIQTVEDHGIQLKDDEARDLFHADTRVGGLLSRQTGGSMMSCDIRRRKWIQRLSSVDSSTSVSENILADYFLGGAGLSKEEEI